MYGCPKTEVHRTQYYLVMEGLMGRYGVKDFKAKTACGKWCTTQKWLNGGSSWGNEDFDRWFEAFLDMLAALLRVHPKWG